MGVDWTAVVATRMQRQGLAEPLASVGAAAAAMVGAHAQVMSAAELALGIRTTGTTATDVRRALAADGTLVKTYGPRGTVHLLPKDDLPLWCAALSALPTTTSLPVDARLSESQRDEVIAAIATALDSDESRANPPDADELGRAVVATTGTWAADPVTPAFGAMWPRWRQAIAAAAHHGVLAFGAPQGNRVTYLNPHIQPAADPDEAIGWLVGRFLHTYGPAGPRTFARWLGIPPASGVREFAARHASLSAVSLVDSEAFVAVGDEEAWMRDSTPHAPTIRLLPHFDPYVIGSFPRELVFAGVASERALAHGQAGTHPVLLVNGVVGGVWNAKRQKDRIELTVEALAPLDPTALRLLTTEATRIGAIVELEPTLDLGVVATRSHL